jgi:hypothetical protein
MVLVRGFPIESRVRRVLLERFPYAVVFTRPRMSCTSSPSRISGASRDAGVIASKAPLARLLGHIVDGRTQVTRYVHLPCFHNVSTTGVAPGRLAGTVADSSAPRKRQDLEPLRLKGKCCHLGLRIDHGSISGASTLFPLLFLGFQMLCERETTRAPGSQTTRWGALSQGALGQCVSPRSMTRWAGARTSNTARPPHGRSAA